MWTLQQQPAVVATMPITMDLRSYTVGQVLGAQHLKSLLYATWMLNLQQVGPM
jgi:hypothetical protein